MNIPFRPILSAMTRHKAGVFLIAMQIALTLAIVANAVFVISQRIAYLSRPSGIDEDSIVIVDNRWVGALTAREAQAKTAADLAVLRQLAGVVDAYADYSYPAAGPVATVWAVNLTPDQATPTSFSEPYFADEHALSTYGVRLIAGRNFTPTEILDFTQTDKPVPGPIIVTQDLAAKVFPNETALGKMVYVSGLAHTIVGVIANMEVPAVSTRSFAYRSILSPSRMADSEGSQYIVRAQPGQAERVRHSLAASLYAVSRMRILDETSGVLPFHALRERAYARDFGLVVLLSTACLILMLATIGGIVGITIFWVGERQRQIGVRRALGATRADILAYILAENFMIVTGGIMVGALLALLLNLGLMHYLEMASMPSSYIALGSVLVLILGQCAALSPARRASKVSPMEANRLATG
jgi:putative ABC transport system permease protein